MSPLSKRQTLYVGSNSEVSDVCLPPCGSETERELMIVTGDGGQTFDRLLADGRTEGSHHLSSPLGEGEREGVEVEEVALGFKIFWIS